MRPWRSLSGLPREVWMLCATTLVNRLGSMALPFLVLYLTRRLGFPPPVAGAMLALYGACALVAAPVAGRLCDRIGPLRIMKVSLFLTGAVLLAFPLAKSLAAVALGTVAWAFSNELFRPANLAAVSDLVRPEQRKPAFALMRLAVNLGMSVGPAAGGFLATVSFPALFAVDGATSIAAAIVLTSVPWRAAARHEPADATATDTRAVRDPRLLFFLVSILPVGIVFFQHESAMALFLVRNLHLRESVYGLMFTLNTLLIVALEVPLNAAIAAWPHRRTLALGAFLCGSGFGLLVFARDVPGVAATVVVWTFGEMTLLPGMSAYVADIAPPERRGEYMGLYTMAFNLAFAVGPWLGTVVLDGYGPTVLWSATFLFGAASAALLLRVGVARPMHEHPPTDG